MEAEHQNIIRDLKKRKELYIDNTFPPDKAFFYPGSEEKVDYRWLRPHEIESGAKFVKDGFSQFDINQGGLGNCWFLSAVAALTKSPNLLSRVIPPGQTLNGVDYCGAFRFRFVQFGETVEVMVDDRLPVMNDYNDLVAVNSYDGEFWVCLLEKAFAKLHGCYEALVGGLLLEGLADLTGGVCEVTRWRDGHLPASDLGRLPRYLQNCLAVQLPVTAGTPVVRDEAAKDKYKNAGIVPRHAYSVTGVTQVRVNGQTVDLIRLSNPWGPLGETEWTGRWSDYCPLWTAEQMREAGLVEELDGEGWMNFTDFQRLFDEVDILHMARNSEWGVTGAEWTGQKIHIRWTAAQAAAAVEQMPMIEVDFPDRNSDSQATCVLSLEEPDQRHLPEAQQKFAAKAVRIYRHDDLTSPVKQLEQAHDDNERTLVGHIQLSPGRYKVMAQSLTQIQGQQAELRLLLRVFKEA